MLSLQLTAFRLIPIDRRTQGIGQHYLNSNASRLIRAFRVRPIKWVAIQCHLEPGYDL